MNYFKNQLILTVIINNFTNRINNTNNTLKYFIIVLLVCITGTALGQATEYSFSINGTVYDSVSNQAIPFVSISKKRDHKGTISDFEGRYKLDNVRSGDSVTFSFIGYEMRVFIINKEELYDTIYLNHEIQQLDEVVVLGDNTVLYELIDKSQNTVSTKDHIAKTYFELETYKGELQLELFQGYYNGTFREYNTADLNMKNGRFALVPISKRIFASTESSKAMYMHQLMHSNIYFPTSPFELNKKRLRKTYDLTMSSKYIDENHNTIYVIQFDPKKSVNDHFSGNVWIDSASAVIYKVLLKISDTKTYPFTSIWPNHSLDKVSMEISKSYFNHQGEMVISSIDFNYNLTYISEEDSAINIATRAILHAYNYNDSFILPFFNFTETSNSDYRRIQMLPYNDAFWQCEDEFKIENNGARRTAFINEQATIKAYQLFSSDTLFRNNFFENPYITWNGNPIIIRGISADSSKYYDEKRTFYSDRYNLKVQLFADVNKLCDSVQVITKTIFDPYHSYFHFETSKENQAFLNIYFSLMEIERNKLASQLEVCEKDRNTIELTYNAAVERANQLSDEYFKEVMRGTNKEALQKWNNVVLKALNIDTIRLFGIDM